MTNNSETSIQQQEQRVVTSLGSSPLPALVNSALLFVTPMVSPAVKVDASGGVFRSLGGFTGILGSGTKSIGPSNKTVALFGTAQALGSWMIYDGDVQSGSGFLAAWSALYLIVAGRGSFKALRYRTWPLALSVAAASNAYLYTREFVTSGFI
ncbi:LAMI_0E03664g1_1 [Lachancea mirantina]|uniref:LAMI_0E03664g1_1 n=1 Tax=Lachancea mirantina TaxID=1230905 RepID=A0A1G4JK20_9SACH|nr:LAMI_0E03664g1_1 [Lachancea mirantina]